MWKSDQEIIFSVTYRYAKNFLVLLQITVWHCRHTMFHIRWNIFLLVLDLLDKISSLFPHFGLFRKFINTLPLKILRNFTAHTKRLCEFFRIFVLVFRQLNGVQFHYRRYCFRYREFQWFPTILSVTIVIYMCPETINPF